MKGMLHITRPHQNRAHPPPQAKGSRRSGFRLVYSPVQWRYSLTLGLTCLILSTSFAATIWYFINQNYAFFQKIAYDTHPGLVSHLEREQNWISAILVIGCLMTSFIVTLTTLRITSVLLGPLVAMEKHMHLVIRGDWSSSDFQNRHKDEIREITSTYAYLYRTFRAQSESELKVLEKVLSDPRNREVTEALHNLVNLKKKQMGFSADDSSRDSASVHDSRRAS